MTEVRRALERLLAFTKEHGLVPLVRLYRTLVDVENHTAVASPDSPSCASAPSPRGMKNG